MIVVTGGAGFIGSNIIKALNNRGFSDILVVDDLTDGRKCINLCELHIIDYLDMDDFLKKIQSNQNLGLIEAVFHQGACSSTTEWDGKFLMRVNYEYTKNLLEWTQSIKVPFYYASSASVYGKSSTFKELSCNEYPLNPYAFSKLLFDQYLRSKIKDIHSPVVGLRYFNVYGPREQHKGSMASVAFKIYQQLKTSDTVQLFESSDGFKNGCQKRDFIYVDDVADVNLWLLDNQNISGIFNCGTGSAQSFNEVAKAMISTFEHGRIEYVPIPKQLKGVYQSYTQADMESLRKVGYKAPFRNVEQGIRNYVAWLNEYKI